MTAVLIVAGIGIYLVLASAFGRRLKRNRRATTSNPPKGGTR